MRIKALLMPVAAVIVAAAVLFGLSAGLSGLRNENVQKEHVEMMRMLLPGSTDFVIEPYTGDDANIRSVHKAENGFVIETNVQGYVDDITMMVGVSNEGRVTGLVVRDMHETFGLGANVLTDHEFLAQFLNTAGNISVVSNTGNGYNHEALGLCPVSFGEADTEVDAITGATVTSKAIARSVNSAVAVVTGADAASAATSWGG
ncbi:MAG: FMN-binding protein [Clostridia bacterium]|nr:FMN-binding protein [Clostridia bacterium]